MLTLSHSEVTTLEMSALFYCREDLLLNNIPFRLTSLKFLPNFHTPELILTLIHLSSESLEQLKLDLYRHPDLTPVLDVPEQLRPLPTLKLRHLSANFTTRKITNHILDHSPSITTLEILNPEPVSFAETLSHVARPLESLVLVGMMPPLPHFRHEEYDVLGLVERELKRGEGALAGLRSIAFSLLEADVRAVEDGRLVALLEVKGISATYSFGPDFVSGAVLDT